MATTRKGSSKSKSRKQSAKPKARQSSQKPTRKAKSAKKAKKSAASTKSSKTSASAKSPQTTASAKSKKSTKSPQVVKSSKSPKALRLTFSYEGNKVKLVSQEAVEMTVQPSDRIKDYYKQTGFWAEIRNTQAKTLYRRVMHNPIRKDVEVFSDDPEVGITRRPTPKQKGRFVVLLPDTDQSHEALVCRSRPEPKRTGSKGSKLTRRAVAVRPPQVLASVKLKK